MLLGCSDGSPTPDLGLDASGGDLGRDVVADDTTLAPDARHAGPCDPASTGLVAPLPACTAARPCKEGAAKVTVPSEPPECKDPRWGEVASQTVAGFTRYACIYRPPNASGSSPRPLVLFFHPGGEGAVTAEAETGLLDKAATTDLSKDPSRPGFLFVAVQGRALFFPTAVDRNGERHHDFYFRDLASPSSNPDIANADAWIDRLVAEKIVDPKRIFVVGWSNGGFFGQLYTIARHKRPTPGGSRVAAAAVFSAADPFHDILRDPFTDQLRTGGKSCQLDSYPTSSAPILLVYRTCDAAVPCGASDGSCYEPNPGYVVNDWLSHAPNVGIAGLQGFMLNGLESSAAFDSQATGCSDLAGKCSSAKTHCLVNHLRWPDGAYGSGGSGPDREPGMLLFLRAHPLGP